MSTQHPVFVKSSVKEMPVQARAIAEITRMLCDNSLFGSYQFMLSALKQ